LRLSADGENFAPLTSVGRAHFKFPCGRMSGYESAEYLLPKNAINDNLLLIEEEHYEKLIELINQFEQFHLLNNREAFDYRDD